MASSSSSSSSVILESKYDVFLSFRGKDTRNNFTSHLHASLCKKKIQTFIDDDGLKRGDDISPALSKAIEGSEISVIIFSEDYASSSWCLDELVKILECKKIIVPVFYHVNPSDIRKQTGSFEDAFVKHEERFKEMPGKVQKWRDALTEAANLSGWDSTQIWPESKLVDEIVGDILKKLDATSAPSYCEGLVGIDSKVEHIKSLLCISSSDFRVLGIWGMGGIGKTTIAEVVFNQIRGHFEGCCFIGNVREESQRTSDGLVRLKEQLLSKILGEVNLNIGTLNALPIFLKRRVQRTKILVVLDDVSNSEQLKVLSGGIDRFCPGSRVIITTRDKQVLCNYEEACIYKVEELNNQQANKLFSNYAFKQNHPLDDLVVLSHKIIDYAKGNPLALRVLGSSLYNKGKQVWESALNKMREISNPKIDKVLRISYNLLDHEEQDLFLDIACLFKGKESYHVMKILDGCYLGASAGLDALIDKSLVIISESNTLEMHDLLQDMGREIVQEESKNPSKRSRLWNPEDIYYVLKKNRGTNKVEAIFLDMSKIKEVHLRPRVFANMENLKFLKFFKPWYWIDSTSTVHLPKGLKYLPDKLSYLHWDGYPLKALASKFSLENLVKLDLRHSKLEKLWAEAKHAPNLRFINLDYSRHLTEIPDLSFAPQLEIIGLEDCESLLEIQSSIQCLHNLRFLSLIGCKSLRKFPSNIHFKSLTYFNLRGCINLTEFPNVSGEINYLYLDCTSIKEVPSSIKCLPKLCILSLTNCKSLKSLPTSICMLKDLRLLDLRNCPKLEYFPEIMERMEHLEYLYLSGAAIKELPSSIENLNGLKELLLRGCILMRIPEEIFSLSTLITLDLRGNRFESFPTRLKQLSNLKELYLSNCDMLQSTPELPLSLKKLKANNYKQLQPLEVPPSTPEELERLHLDETSIKELPCSSSTNSLLSSGFAGSKFSAVSGLHDLHKLNLSYCNLLKIPEDLCSLSSLEYLNLRGNDFESLPTRLKQLSNLEYLYLSNCDMLQSIPELPLSLYYLEANNCKQLQSLTMPRSSSCLEEYHEGSPIKLSFMNCMKLNLVWADPHLIQHCYGKRPNISLCLPGSEIPDWFSYRNSGSSLTIQLPQFWYNGSFIGFAVCAVIASQTSQFREWALVCRCHFENYDAGSDDFPRNLMFSDFSSEFVNSDHIMIGFDFTPMDLVGDCTKALFEIELLGWDEDFEKRVRVSVSEFEAKVKYCGVSPLYKNEANMTPSIFTDRFAGINEDLVETMLKECPKIRKFDNEQEVEPYPKRICRNQINAPSDHNHKEHQKQQ